MFDKSVYGKTQKLRIIHKLEKFVHIMHDINCDALLLISCPVASIMNN